MGKEMKMAKTIKEIRDGLSELIADIDKMQEPVKDVWPQACDVYITIDSGGNWGGKLWRGNFSDLFRKKTGNIFRTKQDAEYHIQMISLAWKIKQHAFEPDWDDDEQSKYSAFYDHFRKKIGRDRYTIVEEGRLFFETIAQREAALKDVSDKDFLYMMRKGLI